MEQAMTTKPIQEEKPWQPRIDRTPEFNPFVNPLNRELENSPPLEQPESDYDEPTPNTHASQTGLLARLDADTQMPQCR
jgi:hypothetical protein